MTIMSVGDSAQVVASGSDAHPRKPVPALGCFPPATDRAAPLFFALTYNLFSSSLLISPDPPFGQLLLKSILIYPPGSGHLQRGQSGLTILFANDLKNPRQLALAKKMAQYSKVFCKHLK